MAIGNTERVTDVEVFPVGGAFQILLGKPFLRQAGLLQDFRADTLRDGIDGQVIANENPAATRTKPHENQPDSGRY